jgi:hypothetical protein
MVLHVKEHVVSGAIFEHAAKRTRERSAPVTIVMDRPNGEERGKALSCSHRQDVITKP